MGVLKLFIMKTNKKIVISIILGVIVIFSLGLFIGTKTVHYDFEANYIRECELKYWETKAQLVDEVQNYISTVAPTSDLRACVLVDACEEYNIEVKFALAQGELESHFGTKGLASKTNSVWNVGSYDGHYYADIMNIYKYPHPNMSIEPYLKLLYKNYLTHETEEGLLRNFVDHNGNRFASDKNYEERLRYKYRSIGNNTQIDSLSAQLNYWRIKCNR